MSEDRIITGEKRSYEVLNKINRGAFGSVYYGMTKDNEMKQVALKFISKDHGFETIENEINIMKRCTDQPGKDFKHVVKLLDKAETKEEIIIVMEMCEGGSL